MNTNTTSSSAVYASFPGYGFRFLNSGEVIQEGDDVLIYDGTWVPSSAGVGQIIGEYTSSYDGRRYQARRKIDVGEGYRLVGEDENIIEGDDWYDHFDDSWNVASSSQGSNPKAYNKKYCMMESINAWRRKIPVEAPKPAPKFSVNDRVILTSERYGDARYNPVWEGDSGKVAGTVTKILPEGYSLPLRVTWDNGETNSYSEDDLSAFPVEAPKPTEVTPEIPQTIPEDYELVTGGLVQEGDLRYYAQEGEEEAEVRSSDGFVDKPVGWFCAQFYRKVNFKARAESLQAKADYQKELIGNLEERVANQRKEIEQLHSKVTSIEVAKNALQSQLHAAQLNASGNVVLVRKNGWCKPVNVPESVLSISCPEVVSSNFSYQITSFEPTGISDGFGRRIFKEVA